MHCGLMLEGSNRTTKRNNTPAFTYSVCAGVGGHFQAPARGLSLCQDPRDTEMTRHILVGASGSLYSERPCSGDTEDRSGADSWGEATGQMKRGWQIPRARSGACSQVAWSWLVNKKASVWGCGCFQGIH